MTELKLIKTFDRIDALIDAGRWSFRQPKKQRGVGGLMKTHWDYLMDEMVGIGLAVTSGARSKVLHARLEMDAH